ncbi:MAG: folate-binding protein YgfZ [Candidatus Binatia bacterium]
MTDAVANDLVSRGAVLEQFHGLALPAHFGDPEREWRAARGGAAAFPAAYRRLIAATGADRAEFLQGMLTNDVKALVPGTGCYAAQLNQTGKVITDLRVYADAERMWLDVVAWRAALMREQLERFIIADDVELTEIEQVQPLIHLEGPTAAAVAGEVLGLDALPATPFAHQAVTFNGRAVEVANASETGIGGVLIWGAPASTGPLLDACREAGAVPAGMRALDMLRIEAGVPWPGIDMDETTLIMEIGLDPAISFSKGCYLGQELVERVSARGHVNRVLRGLVLEAGAVPAPRAPVLLDDREVGYATSAARSPLLERPIALTVMQRKHAAPGTRVHVGASPATVAELPFSAPPDS